MSATINRRPFTRTTALLVVCVLTLLGVATGCDTALGSRDQQLINQERAAVGLPALGWDDNAAAKAQAWAQRLAASRTLAHSRLTDGIDGAWSVLGENVGFARTVDATHSGFMGSARHRSTMLDPAFTSVGVGVAQNGGLTYVVEVYRG